VPVEIGFRADAQLRMGLATLTPWAQVALVHEFFNSRDQYASLTAIPDTPQRVYGARTARDTLQLKGGAQFSLTRTAALFVSGEADLAPGQHIFSGKGGFRYGW
jgi:outer membrane autotransporter protein